MGIRVEAHGSLRQYAPPGTVLDDVRSVGEAVERLNLPGSVGVAMLVNGRLAHWNTPLHDGDVLQLVPTLAGGE